MIKFFPNFQGVQPPKADFLSAPKSVLNFCSSVVNNLKVTDKMLKVKDKLLAAKDATIAALNAKIKRLKGDNKILEAQVKALKKEICDLKNRLNMNSTNSNIPPSKDPIGFDRSKESDKKGKKKAKKAETQEKKAKAPNKDKKSDIPKKAHPGAKRPVLRPTDEKDCKPKVCPHCGCTHFVGLTECGQHQHVELPKTPLIVTLFHIFTGRCENCGTVCKGEVPEESRGFFGPRFEALASWLDSMTGSTRRQITTFFRDVVGYPLSQGGLQRIIDRASNAILPHYELIAKGARKCLYNHIDETSWPTHGPILRKALHWLWVMGNAFIAFFRIDPHRSEEAFKKLVAYWKGLMITDDYGLYLKWDDKRQTCLAHYLREAKKLAESSNAEEAECGKKILSLLHYICSQDPDEPLPPNFLQNLERRSKDLANTFGHLPGKSGGLIMRIFKGLDAMVLFLYDELATKTNNFAEGLVRTAECSRKISYGTALDKGERWIERSLSLRKTCLLNGKSYFLSLVDAIGAKMKNARPNLYWIRKATVRVTQKEFLVLRPH